MDKEIKAAWVAALTSGEYKQTRGRLRNVKTNGMCCLGVLCDVMSKRGKGRWRKLLNSWKFVYKNHNGLSMLPSTLDDKIMVNDVIIVYKGTSYNFIELNDSLQLKFKTIAKLIDEQL